MEQFLKYSHILGGSTVLLLGILNFVNRKGAKNHRLIGKIYVGAMWWICLSALLILSFYRFSFFLLVISVITFYASFVGLRVLRRKQVGSESWYDRAVAALTSLFGISLFGYGIYVFWPFTQFSVVGLLSLIFGSITFKNGFDDLRFFYRKPAQDQNWWLRQHIGTMGGSYIAALTAFAVQNGGIFFADQSYRWLTWVLPTVIFAPLLSIIQRRFMAKRLPQAFTKSATTA
jgi:uncharacterized membrane protein